MSFIMFMGLNIHKLLSDKNLRGNVTKTHEGALLPRVFWSHFHEGFRQTAIYDQEMINPDYNISAYNNIFNYLL